jgi:hypothetical protein
MKNDRDGGKYMTGSRRMQGIIILAPLASFASLRLRENRRLNEEANLSQRRKGAKAPPFKYQRLSTPG